MSNENRYIVIGRGGKAMMLGHYDNTPRGGVLLFGRLRMIGWVVDVQNDFMLPAVG